MEGFVLRMFVGGMWRGLVGTNGAFDTVWVDRASGEKVRRVRKPLAFK